VTIRIVTGPDQGDAPLVFTAVELHPDWLVLNYISWVRPGELVKGMTDGRTSRGDLSSRDHQHRHRCFHALGAQATIGLADGT
jgi:hypothetical protein